MEEEKKVIRKIIGLYGRKNSGKTTTLNLLIELLGEKGKGDDPVTIENYRGKKIVISPGGDTKAIVQKNIKFFEDQGGYFCHSNKEWRPDWLIESLR